MGTILTFQTFRRPRADGVRLAMRLYDGILLVIAAAGTCMRARDCAGKGRHISTAIEMLAALTAALDRHSALSCNLAVLYTLCAAWLLRASARMDAGSLTAPTRVLAALRGGFAALPAMRRLPGPARILPFAPQTDGRAQGPAPLSGNV